MRSAAVVLGGVRPDDIHPAASIGGNLEEIAQVMLSVAVVCVRAGVRVGAY